MLNRFKFPLTVDEYEKLYEDGPLSEDFNTELLGGLIVPRSRGRFRSCSSFFAVADHCRVACRGRYSMSVRSLLYAPPDPPPAPDFLIFEPGSGSEELLQEMPRAPLLLIHFADSADEFDDVLRGTRAEPGPVPEFWYVDLAGDRVLVFREPDVGGWRVRSELAPGEVAVASRVPGVELSVDRLLARER